MSKQRIAPKKATATAKTSRFPAHVYLFAFWAFNLAIIALLLVT